MNRRRTDFIARTAASTRPAVELPSERRLRGFDAARERIAAGHDSTTNQISSAGYHLYTDGVCWLQTVRRLVDSPGTHADLARPTQLQRRRAYCAAASTLGHAVGWRIQRSHLAFAAHAGDRRGRFLADCDAFVRNFDAAADAAWHANKHSEQPDMVRAVLDDVARHLVVLADWANSLHEPVVATVLGEGLRRTCTMSSNAAPHRAGF